MKKITIMIDDYLYAFYTKVGENAGGIRTEQVMADALFKLARELSINAINEKSAKKARRTKISKFTTYASGKKVCASVVVVFSLIIEKTTFIHIGTVPNL